MKFRKRPVVVEAVQIKMALYQEETLVNLTEIYEFCPDAFIGQLGLYIKTLEGIMLCSAGDWIIRGVNGEFYPCKPDIFEKTYERVEK